MLKRFVIMLALVGGFSMTGVSEADAWVVRRVAPVRRAARVALPPYPVARRVIAGPIYRRPFVYGGPVIYARPRIYASPSVYFAY